MAMGPGGAAPAGARREPANAGQARERQRAAWRWGPGAQPPQVHGVSTEDIEDLETFRQRARAWIRENLRAVGPIALSLRNVRNDEEELAAVARDREIQRMLYDADF